MCLPQRGVQLRKISSLMFRGVHLLALEFFLAVEKCLAYFVNRIMTEKNDYFTYLLKRERF